MAELLKRNIAGEQTGKITVDDELLSITACPQMIKDYLVALRANQRQWSANTKGRSEVNHSNKKPHAQKGTGKARQGSLASPQFRGGGRVFAPKPKFMQHVRINQKERRAAIRRLVAEKILEGKLVVLEAEKFEKPQTKKISNFLAKAGAEGKRVLFLAEGQADRESYRAMTLSMRNIPKLHFKFLPTINGYDLALSSEIIIFESAVEQLKQLLKG